MEEELGRLREEYGADALRAQHAGSDPMALFAAWFADARDRPAVQEVNAMALATATADASPSVRMVLLKGVDMTKAAFTWYTNLESRKARECGVGDPLMRSAALAWWWPGPPGRQVRAAGRVEQVSRAEAAAYFTTRPRAARVAAAASRQSRPIGSRAELERRIEQLDAADVALPDTWGGLRLVADEIEFWQGRSGRAHDRIAFLRLDHEGGIVSPAAAAAAGGEDALRAAGSVVVDVAATRWLRVRLQP